jgi:hypothetical protein
MTTKFATQAALAAVLLSVVPAAQAELRGFVDASVGTLDVDVGPLSDDATLYGLGGSLRGRLTDTINFQGDLRFNRSETDIGDSDVWGPTLHLYGLVTPSTVLGGYVGYADVDSGDSFGGGVNVATRADRFMLGGRVGYARTDDTEVDAVNINGAARFYPTENLMIGGAAGWTRLDGPLGDTDSFGLGVEGEYGFSASPVSIFAGVTYDTNNDVDITATGIRAGVRFQFGQGSLMERQSEGPLFASYGGRGVFSQGGFGD